LLPHLSWAEKIVRPILVYLVLLLLFRLTSRREMAQATLFDFLIILLLSNVVQNAMIGEDNSILGGAVGALTLLLLSAVLNYFTAHSREARIVMEGKPIPLVRNGVIDEDTMGARSVSRNDLLSAIRHQGISRLADVGFAILELDGTISVIKKDDDQRPHDCLPPEVVGAESADQNG
jgi:uncharacterized membrane protein YcaP (DUF421 family)